MPYNQGSSKLLIYFHGNAEDIGLSIQLLMHIRDHIQINVMAMEYPGYGIYQGHPSSTQIKNDALIVYDYITKELGI